MSAAAAAHRTYGGLFMPIMAVVLRVLLSPLPAKSVLPLMPLWLGLTFLSPAHQHWLPVSTGSVIGRRQQIHFNIMKMLPIATDIRRLLTQPPVTRQRTSAQAPYGLAAIHCTLLLPGELQLQS